MKRVSIKLTVACAALLAAAPESNAQPLPMRTLAGNKSSGATNGYGSNARFNLPLGVAADAAGNVYVADTQNGTVRKITPDGFAGSFAGGAGIFGSTNGSGAEARFYSPQGIAVDSAGNVFVSGRNGEHARRFGHELE